MERAGGTVGLEEWDIKGGPSAEEATQAKEPTVKLVSAPNGSQEVPIVA